MNVEKPFFGLTSFSLALHVSSAMMGYRHILIFLNFPPCSWCVNNWCRDGLIGKKAHSAGKDVVNGLCLVGSVTQVPSNGCRVFVASIVVRFLVIDWLLYQIALAMASWALVHVVGAAAGRAHVMRGCLLISAMRSASALGSINRVWVELLKTGSWTNFCRFVLVFEGVTVGVAGLGVAGGLVSSSPVRSSQ